MTNSAKDRYPDLAASGDAVIAGLIDDLDVAYRIEAPPLFMPRPAGVAAEAPYRPWRLDLLRRPVLGLAAALAAVTVVLAASSIGSETQEVSAAAILDRAVAVAQPNATQASGSYYLNATQRTTAKGVTTVETTETWYRDAQHVRTERRNGNRIVWGSSKDGDNLWLYKHNPAGELLVGKVGAANLMGIPANVLGTSLPQVMGVFNASCQTATNRGEDTVAGRKAYVIDTKLNLDDCKQFSIVLPEGTKPEATTTTMWIDKETFFTLKTQTDSAGVQSVYEVVSIDHGTSRLPASFAYQVPAGAKLTDARSFDELLTRPGWNDVVSFPATGSTSSTPQTQPFSTAPVQSAPPTWATVTPDTLQPFTLPGNGTPGQIVTITP